MRHVDPTIEHDRELVFLPMYDRTDIDPRERLTDPAMIETLETGRLRVRMYVVVFGASGPLRRFPIPASAHATRLFDHDGLFGATAMY